MTSACHLCTACREGIDHPDRRLFDCRSRLVVRPADVQPRVDEPSAAERSSLLDAKRVSMVLVRRSVFRQVDAANALITIDEIALRVAEAERLIARDRIVEARIHKLVVARRLWQRLKSHPARQSGRE